jgi:hypothetical protein
MENGEPDKEALELIRRTETALAASRSETEKKARAILLAAMAETERLIREKEDELAQTLRQAETLDLDSWDAGSSGSPAELDGQSLKLAGKIADLLFARLTQTSDGDG